MKKINFDSIIFDMDGVLVSNDSYCKAIKKTVEVLLMKKYNLRKLIKTSYIKEVKSFIGFNNDWDTSFALIKLLGMGVEVEDVQRQIEIITPEIQNSQGYLEVKDIFQTFYLGQELFEKIYKRPAPFKNGIGLIEKENLLIKIRLIRLLTNKYSLGIATSRPKFEALFAAKKLLLTPKFIDESYIVAKEDVQKEKPEPDPLLEAKRRMKTKRPIYIGDTINDVIAAQKAQMPCIFIGDKKIGDFQIKNINQLMEIIL